MQTDIDSRTRKVSPTPAADAEHLLDQVERFLRGETTLAEVYGLSEADVQGLAELADAQLEAGRIDDALVMYEGCVALNPSDVTIVCGYGLTLKLAGRQAQAQEIFSVARILADGDPDVTAFLAAVG